MYCKSCNYCFFSGLELYVLILDQVETSPWELLGVGDSRQEAPPSAPLHGSKS